LFGLSARLTLIFYPKILRHILYTTISICIKPPAKTAQKTAFSVLESPLAGHPLGVKRLQGPSPETLTALISSPAIFHTEGCERPNEASACFGTARSRAYN
jgi:hypothetical protein